MAIESTPTIYTVRDFVNWQRDGTLDLRPPFQRYAIWRSVAKSSLIDSLLRGYPIPALFIQDRTDPTSFHRTLVVVDGQQRLRTILSFVDLSSLRDADDRDRFTILRVHDQRRAGKAFEDLDESDKDRILSSRLHVNIVGSSVVESELLEIFRRMNTYGVRLNAQELRNANYQGLFKEVAYRTSAEALDHWLNWGLFNHQQIAEMQDVEFTSDVLILVLNGTQSATKATIDRAYRDYDEVFDKVDICTRRFKDLVATVDDVYEDKATFPRVVSKMWTYSLLDALQRRMYGGPISETGSVKRTRVPIERVRRALRKLNSLLENETLPVTIERATRGGATDKGSREARAAYLTKSIATR